jgi:hypothetical protein
MNDDERRVTVDRLLRNLSEVSARKNALEAEMGAFAARMGGVSAARGGPCCCSGKPHERSHEPGLLLLRRFCDVRGELTTLHQKLGELGVSVD